MNHRSLSPHANTHTHTTCKLVMRGSLFLAGRLQLLMIIKFEFEIPGLNFVYRRLNFLNFIVQTFESPLILLDFLHISLHFSILHPGAILDYSIELWLCVWGERQKNFFFFE